MRSLVVVGLTLAGVGLAGGQASAQKGSKGSEQAAVRNGWQFSLEAGKQQARQAGKPLMVVVRCVP